MEEEHNGQQPGYFIGNPREQLKWHLKRMICFAQQDSEQPQEQKKMIWEEEYSAQNPIKKFQTAIENDNR